MAASDPLAGRTEQDWSATQAGVTLTLRAAALIIKDERLLVAKSGDFDCYYTLGGGIKVNETSQDAVMREVYEETGYALEVDRLVFTQERFLEVDGRQYHEIAFFYLMKDSADMDVSEHMHTDQANETLHWIPLHAVNSVNIVPPFLKTAPLTHITALTHIISRE